MSIRPRHIVLLLLALLLSLDASAAVPDRAWGKAIVGQRAPMWVSAELAVVDGQLQEEHFHPDLLPLVRQSIEASRPTNSAGCSAFTESSESGGGVVRRSISSIVDESAQVITGSVTGYEQGFLYARPGLMVEVTVDGDRPPEWRRLYVFLRVADIEVDGVHLCSGLSDGRPLPKVGAGVVLVLEERLEEGRILGRTEALEPILEPHANEVLVTGSLPWAYNVLEPDVDRLRHELREAEVQR